MIFVGPCFQELKIDFHFGPEDGHTCDCARFLWRINGNAIRELNFNNFTGYSEPYPTIWINAGPINLAQYVDNLCGPISFSFDCLSGGEPQCIGRQPNGCHDGALMDVTLQDGTIVTRFLHTDDPTVFTLCELMNEYSPAP